MPQDSAAESRPGRSAPELAVLLLELASVLRARTVLAPGESKLAAVFERCVRAWRTDLARHGTLHLELTPTGFRETGGGGVLQHARLGELLADLRGRQLKSLRFEVELDADAFAGFVHLLADPSAVSLRGSAFAARLAALVPIGLAVELEAAPAAGVPAIALADAAPAAPAVRKLAAEVESILAAAPALPAGEPHAIFEPGSAPALADPDSDTLPIHESAQTAPLDLLLGELAECDSTASYLDLARRAVTEAERARDANAVYRVLDAMALHVETKEQQLGNVAQSFLASLCQGDALRDLLERAARGVGAEPVRAAQILAAVGEPAAAALLDRMPAYPEPVQRERLIPLVLSLGERAVPELLRRLDGPETDEVRSAIHLLGMMQHPGAVPQLADLAGGTEPVLREEAGRALVRIGTEDAVAGLARGLRGERAVVISAVQHLAGTASAKAIAPLGHALERALEAKDVELSKEILRALGRIGRPEANVVFGALMRRKPGLTGRWLRDIKVTAASALSTVPGDQAVALLAEALQSRDEPLRKAAQRALDRRAEAVARGSRVVP
ncbi:MAG TPA: HEAT repeat domain-containing protein [Myxococcota bacterium]